MFAHVKLRSVEWAAVQYERGLVRECCVNRRHTGEKRLCEEAETGGVAAASGLEVGEKSVA